MTTELCSGKCDASRGRAESAGGYEGIRKATFGLPRVVQDGKGNSLSNVQPWSRHGTL